MSYGWPTTRVYPRSLAAAFADERAAAVTHYRRQRVGLLWRAVVLVAACIFIGFCFAEGLTP